MPARVRRIEPPAQRASLRPRSSGGRLRVRELQQGGGHTHRVLHGGARHRLLRPDLGHRGGGRGGDLRLPAQSAAPLQVGHHVERKWNGAAAGGGVPGRTAHTGIMAVHPSYSVASWTKEHYRHQSRNVVFTGHFVWGGEAIW